MRLFYILNFRHFLHVIFFHAELMIFGFLDPHRVFGYGSKCLQLNSVNVTL